jgi:hypothetical protein
MDAVERLVERVQAASLCNQCLQGVRLGHWCRQSIHSARVGLGLLVAGALAEIGAVVGGVKAGEFDYPT